MKRFAGALVTVALVVLFPLTSLAAALPPIERMVGANFVFRGTDTLCSATLFSTKERWALTNYHCIEDSIRVIEQDDVKADGSVRKVRRIFYDEVTLSQSAYGSGRKVGELTLRAKILDFDKPRDLAVLQIMSETTPLVYAAQIPSDKYQMIQGQVVYGVGNPIGLENTITRGVLSHLYREHRWEPDRVSQYIQTDATTAGGSSGGALYDEGGNLIGVPAAGYRGVAINFAIPITEVKTFLRDKGFASAWDSEALSREEWVKQQKKEEIKAVTGGPPS